MHKSLSFVIIITAKFPESHEFPKNILKYEKINIYSLWFVLFILTNFRTVSKFSV